MNIYYFILIKRIYGIRNIEVGLRISLSPLYFTLGVSSASS